MTKLFNAALRAVWVPMAALALSACGPSISGTYESQGMMGDMMSFEFRSGGIVRMNVMGQIVEGSYKVEGDELKITANNMTQIFLLDDNKCFNVNPAALMCPAK